MRCVAETSVNRFVIIDDLEQVKIVWENLHAAVTRMYRAYTHESPLRFLPHSIFVLMVYPILRKSKILPLYYDNKDAWMDLVFTAMNDICPAFDSDRMADEYYTKMYNC